MMEGVFGVEWKRVWKVAGGLSGSPRLTPLQSTWQRRRIRTKQTFSVESVACRVRAHSVRRWRASLSFRSPYLCLSLVIKSEEKKGVKMVAKDPSRAVVTESMNPYEKPPSMSVRQSMKTFIYNRETGAFMGRTARSWGKIGLFYFAFYGVLAALVAMCFFVFFQTLDPRIPRWQLERSIIGTNPGLGFRPTPPEDNVESTLIWFKASDKNSYLPWVKTITNFLDDYRKPGSTPGRGANIKTCDYTTSPERGQVCVVDVDHLDPCTQSNFYNFHKSAPCIFLKLNRIYGWKPEYYNDTVGLPDKMPRDLKDVIAKIKSNSPAKLRTIWVSCEGENPADVENIGPIHYIPRQGFPGFYYPYENSEGYQSPLVAVYFERPQPGVLINVECKAWAKNIIHGRNDKIGSVHFELLID